ncbi:MAG: ClC family H(+)/Cl(-) exchange transporter [Actinomycetota bacterium]|nr:MAG: ClC family H(+)/Cl(-) exchange transporter [Actinomycetota bacterium]
MNAVDPSKNNTVNTLRHWYSFRLKLIAEGILIGSITGLIVVLFRLLLEKIEKTITGFSSFLEARIWLYPVFFIGLILIGLLIGVIIKKEPTIRGSGIPQIEGFLLKKFDMSWWKVILGKLIGGVLAIGSGLSLGREGPSIQIGAAVGLGFSRVFKRIRIEENFLVSSGASAGLAAAFNAPLAGVMFALEEIHKRFSHLILLSAIPAAIAADIVSEKIFKMDPIFSFVDMKVLPLNNYIYLIILGGFLGIFGAAFNISLLKYKELFIGRRWLPVYVRPVIPLILAGVFIIFYPQVLGGGLGLIESLTTNSFTLNIVIVLLLLKFGFTIISYGSGAPGGIFLPMLAIGALSGKLIISVIQQFSNVDPVYINNFIVFAMAGYFAAVVKAPITGIVLLTEMSGSFQHFLPLSLVVFIAYVISSLLGTRPIYESLMERSLENREYKGFTGNRKVKVVIEIPVCIDSKIENKKIKEINWPDDCLLIGIKRAGQELIPKGDTLIYPGDILIIITNEDRTNKVQHLLTEITGINEIEAHYQYEINIIRFLRKIARIFGFRGKD